MSCIWDLDNKTSDYSHIKIKLHIYVALKSHIWHVLNYIYVDLYFSDVCRALVTWVGGCFLQSQGKIEVLSVFSLFFDGGGSVCECRCVYTHTHTHTLHVGYSRMWAQGSGWDTWRSRRIQMDYISACMYSYVCTEYICIHTCLGAGRDRPRAPLHKFSKKQPPTSKQ